MEKIQAGDFLEGLGNRKSEFIILAITEYLAAHPKMQAAEGSFKIIVKPSVTQEQVKAMITALLEEKISAMIPGVSEANVLRKEPIVSETDIDTMLENLDIFSQ